MSDESNGAADLKVRVNGPYKHGFKFRCVETRSDGEVTTLSFESEAEARAYVEAARRVSVGVNLRAAVNEYLVWLQEAPGRGGRARRDSTVKLSAWRLRGILRCDEEDYPLWGLTRSKARAVFAKRETEVAVDTLAGELAVLHRAVAWWVKKGWMEGDPFVGCEVKGSRSAGKPQLRVTEARRFKAVAATEGVPGLAARLALLTGMRAAEVTGLIVRDIDDGTIWITRAKTKRGVRRLELPEELRPEIEALCAGREPSAPLWGTVDRHWLHYHVVRICELAGVPRVTPHGLRGTFATLASGRAGTKAAAEALGHDERMTTDVYAAPGAEARRVVDQLSGVQVAGREAGDAPYGGGRDDRADVRRHDGQARPLASDVPETSALVTTADGSLPGQRDLPDTLLN